MYPALTTRSERLSGTLALSLVLHGALAGLAIGQTRLGLHLGQGWGKDWGPGRALRVNAVSSLPGIPLPAPLVSTSSTVATESPGLYKNEPVVKPPEPARAEEVPKFQHTAPPEKVERVNKRIQKEIAEVPENAVPFGQGGKPSMSSSPMVNAAGEGGLNFGEGNFGERYGWYVSAVRSRISGNWLVSTISPNILTAPRVYLSFDILRDGTVTNVRVTQSSGIPEIDRSALRAVLASNPLGQLPPDYSGSKVSVDFYFDFRRK